MRLTFDSLGSLPDVEELTIVWAYWSLRTFEGRGASFIEEISPCVHNSARNLTHILKDRKDWKA
jgi:hypothetical protein